MVIIYRKLKFYWSFKKFIFNLLICAMVLMIAALYLTNSVKADPNKQTSFIIVQRGDTLWSIARSIAPQSDPRAVIDRIKRDNQLPDSRLIAGQALKIVDFD